MQGKQKRIDLLFMGAFYCVKCSNCLMDTRLHFAAQNVTIARNAMRGLHDSVFGTMDPRSIVRSTMCANHAFFSCHFLPSFVLYQRQFSYKISFKKYFCQMSFWRFS